MRSGAPGRVTKTIMPFRDLESVLLGCWYTVEGRELVSGRVRVLIGRRSVPHWMKEAEPEATPLRFGFRMRHWKDGCMAHSLTTAHVFRS
jgi:hypothetical protein